MIVYVLMDCIAHEGGSPRGVYSTEAQAIEEARKAPHQTDFEFWTVHPIELDAPQDYAEPTLVTDLPRRGGSA